VPAARFPQEITSTSIKPAWPAAYKPDFILASCSCVHIQMIEHTHTHAFWYIMYVLFLIGCQYIKIHDVYITCNMRYANIIHTQYTDEMLNIM